MSSTPDLPVRRDPVGDVFGLRAGPWERFTGAVMLKMALRGADVDPSRRIPLTWRPSPFVEGLRVFERGLGDGSDAYTPPGDGLVVGTVRMGFGHHRIAWSAYTWALAQGVTAYMHDLLAIESAEAETIRSLDETYSRMSRISSNLGGPFEWLWGRMMMQGGPGSLRMSCRWAELVAPLMSDLPPNLPVISSYPLNGQIAVARGSRRVVNQVIDNHPQYFVLVPGALNLVQSPGYEARLLQMGVPRKDVAVAGSWVSHDIASNAAADSAARIARAHDGRPRRLLVPVGGAGAQRRFLAGFVRGLGPRLKSGSIRLFLNVGDHAHMRSAMEATLDKMGLSWTRLSTLDEVRAFCAAEALDASEPEEAPSVVLCAFESHFEAFATTDLLIRVADVLVTKPSELAFFPVPKLHIRRVGNHEGASALRAAELGDGTPECRKVAEALQMAGFLCDEHALFERMNEDIARNAGAGVYDGSKVAVERALEQG
jgi:hypothetical protein